MSNAPQRKNRRHDTQRNASAVAHESFALPWLPWLPYMMWAGLPWLEAWARIWQMAAGTEHAGEGPADAAGEAPEDRRGNAEAPWLPRITATVIPLHRDRSAGVGSDPHTHALPGAGRALVG